MFVKKTAISLGFLLVFVICLLTSSLYAKPNSTLFSIKRLQEYVVLSLSTNPEQKLSYYQTLLTRRLTDIEYVTVNKHYRYILPTNLRYVTTAGKLTNYTTTAMPNQKQDVRQLLLTHKKRLSSIAKKFVREYPGDDQWRYYTDSQNYLDTYIKQLE